MQDKLEKERMGCFGGGVGGVSPPYEGDTSPGTWILESSSVRISFCVFFCFHFGAVRSFIVFSMVIWFDYPSQLASKISEINPLKSIKSRCHDVLMC